MVKVAGDK